ncbi:unnamed protein product [Soboliphyme baturini]|uniref:Tetraspanin n=1 Tax=Soboliphyme baturini TaxID=241478 RepID=A0A183IV59_9BILA|nr:unnamed protein product [Soboliphyme baturini]
MRRSNSISCQYGAEVISITLVAVGSWSISTKMNEGSRRMTSAWDFAFDAAVIFITVGVIAFVLASAGCIGALRENVVLLKFFWIVLMLIFAIFVLTGVIGFALWPKFHTTAENKLSVKVVKRYFDDTDLNDFMDFIQEKFMCCGLSDKGFHDWNMNSYFNCTEKNHDPRRCGVPHSCCLPETRVCGFKVIFFSFRLHQS